MLIVFAGSPGSGKSTLARALGRVLPAPALSVDPVEVALEHLRTARVRTIARRIAVEDAELLRRLGE
ncbi:AAA family ATPase [Nocardiopsis sp. JB363]|uniref:AAA family ATPase n=1 Tax=Nocardiopsis sp. JB363 TaxID=1434837 RepID=UPI000979F235|nr:AAA family ATPase [Nocardiopsis sp. JB363]SIO84534.1 hypothetical protein BQ8420_02395 [Nocardiopsis sp. JB363]